MINKKRLVALTQRIVQIDSQNPPGNEVAVAAFLKKEMSGPGLEIKTYTFKPNRPNLVITLKGTLPRARAAKEAVLITPHYDTVPIGTGWKFPPHSGKIHQGKIFGRGASDDKGNAAVCLEVMRSLIEDGVRPQRDIICAVTADEETGSHWGIIPLLEKKILKPGVAAILDSDEFYTIIAQKGLIHSKITIYGKKAHAAYNWRGFSAIEAASRVIGRIKELKIPYRKHRLLHGPTTNIGTIKGGDKVNIVADTCEFTLDMRYPPGTDPHQLIGRIKGLIRKEVKKFKYEIMDFQLPYEIDEDHPAVKLYVAASRRLRVPTTLMGSEGATVITFFKKHGIPAFATGYGSRGTAHTTDEYCEIEKLYRGARVLERYLKDYACATRTTRGRSGS